MAPNVPAGPLFTKALKALSEEAQSYLTETRLSDPGVLECFLGWPDTDVAELAHTPADVPNSTRPAGRVRQTRAGRVRALGQREKSEKGPNSRNQRARGAPAGS